MRWGFFIDANLGPRIAEIRRIGGSEQRGCGRPGRFETQTRHTAERMRCGAFPGLQPGPVSARPPDLARSLDS
jgi:hypothetical protein